MAQNETGIRLAPEPRLAQFCIDVLLATGTDMATAEAASGAMMHGSVHGVDSHGVRLLDHYVGAFRGGRLNKSPDLKLERTRGGTAMLDADHGHGARATYAAIDHACQMAGECGIAAVGIRNSSHFGPAGAYTMAAANRGMLALTVCNSDSFVRLHDGASRFHGTNPISVALPSGEENPWLLDMATSAVPYNRVLLYRSLDQELPEGIASDHEGVDTTDPHAVEMLAPVGGAFGFKGAGLGGFAEILSAVMTGMRLSPDILPMGGPDMSSPREMGAFVMVLDPDAFAGAELVRAGMQRYLGLLRGSPAREGARVMAPGDREWDVARQRRAEGIPIDPDTVQAMRALADEYGLSVPF
ncbi:Ldh family oxidoreductase [Thalassovita aquimarina]|uniref:Ldh family oxidoreductase n=1 Tax=Thalassovita aquimarina TaxID=2785917 RepID=A0ABS5HQW6_9RHOB|nr:Ldh family oxidoreductase [Thalassovita aquimarina]MBR9651366.1 Ldh family oxidoreductase [Thalassovita aquimarina]